MNGSLADWHWEGISYTVCLERLLRITFSKLVHDEGEASCAGMQHVLEIRQVVLSGEHVAFCSCVFCNRRHKMIFRI